MLKDRQKQNFENAFINKSDLQINAIPIEILMASSRKLKKNYKIHMENKRLK